MLPNLQRKNKRVYSARSSERYAGGRSISIPSSIATELSWSSPSVTSRSSTRRVLSSSSCTKSGTGLSSSSSSSLLSPLAFVGCC